MTINEKAKQLLMGNRCKNCKWAKEGYLNDITESMYFCLRYREIFDNDIKLYTVLLDKEIAPKSLDIEHGMVDSNDFCDLFEA